MTIVGTSIYSVLSSLEKGWDGKHGKAYGIVQKYKNLRKFDLNTAGIEYSTFLKSNQSIKQRKKQKTERDQQKKAWHHNGSITINCIFN